MHILNMKENRSKKRYSHKKRKASLKTREKVPEKPKKEEVSTIKLIGIPAATRVAATAAVGTFAMLKPDSWATFFSRSIDDAAVSINYFVQGGETWHSFANYILGTGYDRTTMKVSDVIAAMPKALGEKILKLCTNPTECAEKVIDPKKLGYLVLIGVPLSVYLYVQLSGTDQEKEVLEKKLQEAKRLSESSSSSSNKKRRRLQQLTDMDLSSEDSFSSDSKSIKSSNRPESRRRSRRRRNKYHV
jgi:hypothetical protein